MPGLPSRSAMVRACLLYTSEQIVWMSRAQFDQHLQNERALRTAEQIARVGKLREELKLSPMDNPYEYVKASQTHFDGSQIPYSDAYYDILGQER